MAKYNSTSITLYLTLSTTIKVTFLTGLSVFFNIQIILHCLKANAHSLIFFPLFIDLTRTKPSFCQPASCRTLGHHLEILQLSQYRQFHLALHVRGFYTTYTLQQSVRADERNEQDLMKRTDNQVVMGSSEELNSKSDQFINKYLIVRTKNKKINTVLMKTTQAKKIR